MNYYTYYDVALKLGFNKKTRLYDYSYDVYKYSYYDDNQTVPVSCFMLNTATDEMHMASGIVRCMHYNIGYRHESLRYTLVFSDAAIIVPNITPYNGAFVDFSLNGMVMIDIQI